MKQIPALFFVGGFLGAGKTTAIRAMAKLLAKRGLKAAAITNDQAAGLVDTLFLEKEGIPSEEVAGSCFCCNFEGLSDAIRHSIESANPDVILAEPVGSCTDIVATVVRPMRSLMNTIVDVRPYSVLVEPKRWIECEKNEGNAAWSIKFLFDKQLQEADILIINKSDSLPGGESEKLRVDIQSRFPDIKVITLSAKNSTGVDSWLDLVQTLVPGDRWLQEIDYKKYAEAEADMGWLNAKLAIKFPAPVDGKIVTANIAKSILEGVEERNGKIGHIKLLAVGSTGSIKVGTTVLGEPMDLQGVFIGPSSELQIILNIRAGVSPGDLTAIVSLAMNRLRETYDADIEILFMNTFRPGAPHPTYRYTDQRPEQGLKNIRQ